MSFQLFTTKFPCKLCNTEISFNINDPQTFLSKTQHESFFGMQLTTYRVAHTSSSNMERHINVVLVDHAGYFRGYVDAYSEEIKKKEEFPRQRLKPTFKILQERFPNLNEHNLFNLLLVLDAKEYWALEIVAPQNLRVYPLLEFITRKYAEMEQIYTVLPAKVNASYADMELNLLLKDSKIIVASFKKNKTLEGIDDLFGKIVETMNTERRIPQKKLLVIMAKCLNYLSHVTKKDVEFCLRILYDDRLHTRVYTKYEQYIPQIVKRVSSEFPIASEFLEEVLLGRISFIELLEQNYAKNFREIAEIIGFINRRKLL